MSTQGLKFLYSDPQVFDNLPQSSFGYVLTWMERHRNPAAIRMTIDSVATALANVLKA
jgi:hypothetical protein